MSTGTKKHIEVLWKIVLAVACTIMFFMILGVEAKADSVEVNTWESLKSEISTVRPGESKTITLTADITPGNPTAETTCIIIQSYKWIVLDLNGHIINRNL